MFVCYLLINYLQLGYSEDVAHTGQKQQAKAKNVLEVTNARRAESRPAKGVQAHTLLGRAAPTLPPCAGVRNVGTQ